MIKKSKKIINILKRKDHTKKLNKKQEFVLIFSSLTFVFLGIFALWISTFKLPDLNTFEERKVSQSTKIYDRTGTILLYDVHQDTKRTEVPFELISQYVKSATVAIEDAGFYQHGAIKISSIFRSILANLISGSLSQGGSTITQQVIKNSLLTKEKKISRKLKEWVLSIEIEKVMSKDQILSIYLNENPYGGSLYGVEEASLAFFGTSSANLTLGQAAYIAAIPNAPTYYSPYGQHKDKLDERQKLVLSKMLENNFITQEQYDLAKKEKVTFLPQQKYGIRAPHFVEFIKEYLVEKYGEAAVQENGYKVITTLDYSLQEKTETIVKENALSNETSFNAENAAAVAIDPKTGQILAMVGSRDYFDKDIDGNFNVALAHRQPGSTFKPFVYATAFEKGYTPDTVVFDVPTEFQTTCTAQGYPINPSLAISSSSACYMPENYDNLFVGPISLRNALAQSRNIPAIKTLYLAGIKDSLNTAKAMGINSLSDDPNQYGLTLVLGGGEVSLLDIVSAYGVFANDGVRNSYTGVLSITDVNGNKIEEYSQKSEQVISANIAEQISSILSDKQAKIPAYGEDSPLFFGTRQVASKTGTTNDSKDAWTIGYTPEIIIGTWAGNNDNTPMVKKVAGMIVAPMWHQIMSEALASTTGEVFKEPQPIDKNIKPALRGIWQGNETYFIDKISGKLATNLTPEETKLEVALPNIHSILYWVNKSDPLGATPINPSEDAQYDHWEYSVQKWLSNNPQTYATKPTSYDDVHTEANKPKATFLSPKNDTSYSKDSRIVTMLTVASTYPISKVNFYLNNELIETSKTAPYIIGFVPSEINSFKEGVNEFKAVVYDSVYNKNEQTIKIEIK